MLSGCAAGLSRKRAVAPAGLLDASGSRLGVLAPKITRGRPSRREGLALRATERPPRRTRQYAVFAPNTARLVPLWVAATTAARSVAVQYSWWPPITTPAAPLISAGLFAMS